MWFSTVNSYWLNNVFMYWRKWKETDFFFFFLLHCNPDLTFKWKFQQIMTCPYLTESGLKVFERRRGWYLNGKVAPETHNATGLWLSLEPESWTVHLIYSPGDFSTSERVAQVMVILWESYMKQNKTEKQQTQLPIPLYKRCKNITSNN